MTREIPEHSQIADQLRAIYDEANPHSDFAALKRRVQYIGHEADRPEISQSPYEREIFARAVRSMIEFLGPRKCRDSRYRQNALEDIHRIKGLKGFRDSFGETND